MLLPKYKKGSLTTTDGAILHYVAIGSGEIPLVVIPGAGDGLTTLDKAAVQLAFHFRKRARRFRMLIVSRRQPVPAGFGAEDHANDLIWLEDQLGWGPSVWECGSAGGPVGQFMAVKRPDLVNRLVLTASLHRSNPTTSKVVTHWLDLIEKKRWKDFTWSTMEYTFRPQTMRRYQLFKPLFSLMVPPPKDSQRIKNVLLPLLDFDNSPLLPQITCPTLVIAGEEDRVIPVEIQHEMHDLLPESRLVLYPGYGHGNDQENPEYESELLKFAQNKPSWSPVSHTSAESRS
jgi:pimeloyl-ACP methyl ester carboxylesterase